MKGLQIVVLAVSFQLIWGLNAEAWAQKSAGEKQEGKKSSKGSGKNQSSSTGKSDAKGGTGLEKQAVPGGLELFQAADPDKYILGPGDALTINLWGEYDEVYEVEVSPEGKISLPTIGELRFKGLTLTQAAGLLATEVSRYYRNVKSGIMLTSLRAFSVPVLGAVQNPKAYLATSVKRISDLVESAGGILPGGSQRYIQVKQGGRIRAIADLVAFLRKGDESANPYIADGDSLFVPPVSGSVVRVYDQAANEQEIDAPIYSTVELKQGEGLSDLIIMLGGVNPSWDMKNSYVVRNAEEGKPKVKIAADMQRIMFAKDKTGDIVLQDGDTAFFSKMGHRPYLNSYGDLIGIEKEYFPGVVEQRRHKREPE